MRLLSNLRVKGKPAVLPDRAIRRQSHYFIYRLRIPRKQEGTTLMQLEKAYVLDLNDVIPLCIDSIYSLYYIYFSQHNYIIKA